MLKGWILSNGLDEVANSRKRIIHSLLTAAENLNIELKLANIAEVGYQLDTLHERNQLPDFYVYSGVTYFASILESYGVRGFNSVLGTKIAQEKVFTYAKCLAAGIPQPFTIAVPDIFNEQALRDFVCKSIDKLNGKIVVKNSQGSLGEDILVSSDVQECLDFVKSLKQQNNRALIQEYIEESKGIDYRLFVVGDEVVASMERKALKPDEFRSNLALGGIGSVYTPTNEERKMAVAATKACCCEHAGVDILHSNKGPIICEVNPQAHFGIDMVTGSDVAADIMRNIKKKLS